MKFFSNLLRPNKKRELQTLASQEKTSDISVIDDIDGPMMPSGPKKDEKALEIDIL
jgi:hypothetical protein